MHNIEPTIVTLAMGDNTDTPHVATTSDHGDGTSIEPDEFGDLTSFDINLDRIVDFDSRVRVADGAGVVGDEVWYALGTKLYTLDLRQLVPGLGLGDAVDRETSLGVVDEAEVLTSLVDGDHIHEAGGVCGVGADLTVNLDEALHDNCLDLSIVCQYCPKGTE